MLWFLIVIGGYLFGAVANVLDKFLLGSKRISSAPVYAFYVGVFGLGSFVLVPFLKIIFPMVRNFDLIVPNGNIMVLCLISGVLFLAGILLLYFAFEVAEASRVAPIVGAVVPLVTFVISIMLGLEKFSVWQIAGVALLIFGGLLISFDLPLKLGKKKFFAGFYYAAAAGFVLAIAYLMFKNISNHEGFITWYIWTRVGSFFGALGILLIPAWRKNILRSFHSAKKNHKQAIATSGIFLGNKIVGGASTFMLNFAIGLGSVTLLNSLVSIQYVFVLVIVAILSKTKARVFQEKLLFWDWAQKMVAIGIIAVGMFFISQT